MLFRSAILFFGIFATMMPALDWLEANAGSLGLATPGSFYWASGTLSSFLDNAPTYLVFFNLAGGDAQSLMTTGATTLAAISAGAVFMGANSYIGNAPNFMVKAIAESRGVKMPSFFAYLGWALVILVPVFLLTSWIFFPA